MAGGLTKANAALFNAERRAFVSKTLVLKLTAKHVDPDTLEPNHPETATEPFSVIATVPKNWNYEAMSDGENGKKRYRLYVSELGNATAARLKFCEFQIGTQNYDVLKRTEPIGDIDKTWTFTITPVQ